MATPLVFYKYTSRSSSLNDISGPEWRPLSPSSTLKDPITNLRLVTWNIWFDKDDQAIRFQAVIDQLHNIPTPDVVSLQEVTPSFLEMIRADEWIRAEWVMTDYLDANHQKQIAPNWYGNMLLVRKKWAGNIRGWTQKFPTSVYGRFIDMVEIFEGDKSVVGPFSLRTNIDSNWQCSSRFYESRC
jgi:hypothetical protein